MGCREPAKESAVSRDNDQSTVPPQSIRGRRWICSREGWTEGPADFWPLTDRGTQLANGNPMGVGGNERWARAERTSNSFSFPDLLPSFSISQTQLEARGQRSQFIQSSLPWQQGGQRREEIDLNEHEEAIQHIPDYARYSKWWEQTLHVCSWKCP